MKDAFNAIFFLGIMIWAVTSCNDRESRLDTIEANVVDAINRAQSCEDRLSDLESRVGY